MTTPDPLYDDPEPYLRCLVATDLSARGDRALVRAFRLVSRGQGLVTILHVVEDTYPKDILKRIKEDVHIHLRQQIMYMPESQGIYYRIEVMSGHDCDIINERSVNHDMIVLGGRREPKLQDYVLSSTVQRVVRGASVPVLVVKTPYRGPYGLALAGLDEHPEAMRALAFALTTCPEARVVAFHAIDLPTSGARSEDTTVDDDSGVHDHMTDWFAPFLRRLEALPGFRDRGRVQGVIGSGPEALDRLCRDKAPDLLLFGRPHRNRSFFFGEDLPGYALMTKTHDILIVP
ncbi:universal stress protein [Roseospira visakhapatnamensis]|uniref:Nucleotide-binding universal stress UspA family protein n=1 Tax=Roseospira visakhapatnamensis TaxID=390880 RepID=A0A7W6WB48_9PROT|nr:universal stress protein [Roseospira visakhapatnamensis]MBB4267679.1 nucleotide-binding universal stress UspA family protein [Roseospira visakhapatnamensis]